MIAVTIVIAVVVIMVSTNTVTPKVLPEVGAVVTHDCNHSNSQRVTLIITAQDTLGTRHIRQRCRCRHQAPQIQRPLHRSAYRQQHPQTFSRNAIRQSVTKRGIHIKKRLTRRTSSRHSRCFSTKNTHLGDRHRHAVSY